MLLAAPLLLAAAPPTQTAEKADIAALQGFWVLKTTEYLGEKANQDPTDCPIEKRLLKLKRRTAEERELPEDLKKYRITLEFKGNGYDYRRWAVPFDLDEGYIESIKGKYKLDVKRTPRVMEQRFVRVPFGRIIGYCTYQVRGDTLKMGVHLAGDKKNLPKTFTTDKDEDVAVLTFRRERK